MATRQSKLLGDAFVALLGLGTILALAVGILVKRVEIAPARGLDAPVAPVATAAPNPLVVPSQEPEPRADIAVFGKVGTLRLAPLLEVPPSPKKKRSDCRNLESIETSAAGEIAHAAGWNVVSDDRFGSYQVVVVQSGTREVPQAGCMAEGTSVLMFAGDKLIAVAYDSRKTPGTSSLARAERYSDSLIRLHALDGPLAEITLDDTAIRLRYLPPSDPICGGRSTVPRIERTSYLTVRQILKDEGWRAVSIGGPFVVAEELVQGAGPDFWHATYRSPTGDDIVVMTHSGVNDANGNGQIDLIEDPLIDRYGLMCAGASGPG